MPTYVDFLREKAPFAFNLMRMFIFIRQMLFDPANLKRNPYYYRKIKSLQINKKKSVFKDRETEIKEFFHFTQRNMLAIYIRYGTPNTETFKEHLEGFFESKTTTDNELKKAYEKASFFYTLRLMLHYTRFTMIIPYLDHIQKKIKKPVSEIKVLDYGCGVGDIGLLFASLGAQVTIADLDDKRFEFTAWRYKRRGFNIKTIKIKSTADYPNLKRNQYDLIIATELFEHVRDPFRLLNNFTIALKRGGFLFDSVGVDFQKELKGDHLEEAVNIGQSKQYREYYTTHYKQTKPNKALDCLYVKIR